MDTILKKVGDYIETKLKFLKDQMDSRFDNLLTGSYQSTSTTQAPTAFALSQVYNMVESIKIGSGPRSSDKDAGKLNEMSLDDDYLYICVKAGDAGKAIWKKTLMFQT